MPISILPPAPAPSIPYGSISSDEDDEFDFEGDVDMEGASRGVKRPRISQKHIVTPGELVTDDTQWMRQAPFSTSSVFGRRSWTF
jgi:exosome complex component RRP4